LPKVIVDFVGTIFEMDNKEFSKILEQRTRKFAVRIIKLSTTLPHTAEGMVIRNQIAKSGTSIGANYREANRARSRADFKNKIKICESEASETQYWLELFDALQMGDPKIRSWLLQESAELLAIFTTTGKTAKRRQKAKKN